MTNIANDVGLLRFGVGAAVRATELVVSTDLNMAVRLVGSTVGVLKEVYNEYEFISADQTNEERIICLLYW